VQELREADDWKRFANVAIQEQLCARMEALKATEDLDAAAKEVRELQEQWRASADVPRAQADALWRRFKAAHDEVWARCEAHFAVQATERAENLAKKTVLCEQAEALSDSTDWIKTSEALKLLQAEWKTIGPVSRGREGLGALPRCATSFTVATRTSPSARAAGTRTWRKEALARRPKRWRRVRRDKTAGEIRQLQVEWRRSDR
jgi:hypothetical protein